MLFSTSLVIALMADAAIPAKSAKTDKNDPDKIICRREVETGSLVKTRRMCLSRKRWSEVAADARRDAETLQDVSANPTRGD